MALRLFRCILLLIFLASVATLFAQNVATISGQVTDQSGAVLPGATIQVTNEDTGIVRALVTDEEGRFHARELGLGKYRVSASLPGFQTVVRSGVVLTGGREAIVDFKLPVGEIKTEVQVTGDAPLVETTHSDMMSLISRQEIANLPLNARDLSQLIDLQAGTTNYRNQGGDSVSGFGARISVSGVRPTGNSYTLDGSDINTMSGVMPAGVTGATLGVEAIREFSILTSNYSAQYGRAAGANIIAVTKSGTNSFHGSLFEYLRNDNFDARNFFDVSKPEFKRNQFGFSFGGPILKNKIHFFTSLEGLRERLPLPLRGVVLTAAARQGNFPNRKVAISPVVKPYLDLWPLPNGTVDYGNGTAEYIRTMVQPTDQDYFVARVDQQLSQNQSLFVRYTLDRSTFIQPYNPLPLFDNTSATRNHYATIEGKSLISNRSVNIARIGYTRQVLQSDMVAINAPDPSFSFIQGRPFGGIAVTGMTSLAGYDGTYPRYNFLNTYQASNDLSLDRGSHSLKLGGGAEWFLFNKDSYGRYGGAFSWGSIDNFLTNQVPERLRAQGFGADPYRSFSQWLYSAYAQDDVQVSHTLTLNLGLRWEFNTVPTERYGRMADLRSFRDPTTTLGDPFWKSPTHKKFAPRVGFAWDPTGSGKIGIRASFGVFIEPSLIRQILSIIDRQPPYWNEIDVAKSQLAGTFPNLGPQLERLSKGPQAIHALDWNLKSPYTLQQSLSIQRIFGKNLVVEVGYTGTRGVHLPSRTDMATPEPIKQADGRWFFPASAGLVNPNFGRLEWYMTGGSSHYHALKTTVKRRFSQGLQFQGAYTWSRAMDLTSSHVQNELGDNLVMNPWDQLGSNYGLADFHIAHSFQSNLVYELPLGRNWHGIAGGVFKGWQVNGIFALTTGTPTSIASAPTLTHALVRESGRPNLVAGRSVNPILGGPNHYFDTSGFTPQQTGYFGNLGRNTLIGPGLVMVDSSLMKNFLLNADGMRRIQFRAEFFNVPNRPNFALPATNLFDSQARPQPTAGRITRTVTSARQIQFALRFEF